MITGYRNDRFPLPSALLERAAEVERHGVAANGEPDSELLRSQAAGVSWLTSAQDAHSIPECTAMELVGVASLLNGSGDYGLACFLLDVALRNWAALQREHRETSSALHYLSWYFTETADPPPADTPLTTTDVDNPGSSLVHVVADVARSCEGVHRFPHALLALRGSALVHSKFNHYSSAWLTFAELRSRLTHIERSYGALPPDTAARRMILEVQQQALLAETGTAARTIERTLERWHCDTEPTTARTQRLAYHEGFIVLRRGTLTGEIAHDEASAMELSGARALEKLGKESWRRRPPVMTARCHLELIPLARVVQMYGTKSPPDGDDWNTQIRHHWKEFKKYYSLAHRNVEIELDDSHIRELVQLRLHAALLFPHAAVEPPDDRCDVGVGRIPECLLKQRPSVGELATWLTTRGKDANIATSMTAPLYLAWMQRLSGDDALIDWVTSDANKNLRRKSANASLADGDLVLINERARHAFESMVRALTDENYTLTVLEW